VWVTSSSAITISLPIVIAAVCASGRIGDRPAAGECGVDRWSETLEAARDFAGWTHGEASALRIDESKRLADSYGVAAPPQAPHMMNGVRAIFSTGR
jgi:hypothetical protein